ncbi:hypothetical protein H0A36_24945 [Endozoicomonas sp. SM1973]|uniref:Uncharacterized protein n=1 Tax=Spartinivicinus marinus TaxID=2994442 RepID=A0A853IGY0_9GAMM|nr:hypothetical protein [Spartinivicinus marinus]MCX4030318.1 hypothetical protein [Spartinivicinus marinus]NYZ69271.1 hypothetical protein [Spartinivicinus marinus]
MSGIKRIDQCVISHPCSQKKLYVQTLGIEDTPQHQYAIIQGEQEVVTLSKLERLPEQQSAGMTIPQSDVYETDVPAPGDTSKHQLAIKIPTETVSPIYLPLLDEGEVQPTPYTKPLQHNVMALLLPMLYMDRQKQHIGPVRSGYIYIFKQGKLWREVLIDEKKDKAPEFKDVNVKEYRQKATGGQPADLRQATGISLKNLHVPFKLQNGVSLRTAGYAIAFSENQWSWPYIQWLEASASRVDKRCQSLKSLMDLLTGVSPVVSGSNARPIKELPECRSRSFAIELAVSEPWKVIHDVSGDYFNQLLQKARTERNAIDAESDEPYQALTKDSRLDFLHPDLRLNTLHEKWNHARTTPIKPELANWEMSLSASGDILKPYRDKQWFCLVLSDPLGIARHARKQLQDSIMLLQTLNEVIRYHPYAPCADIVYLNLLNQALQDGSPNPLYSGGWFDTALDLSDSGRLYRTIKEEERKMARENVAILQEELLALLEDQSNGNLTETLRDLFTLEGANYICGYIHAAGIVDSLYTNLMLVDSRVLAKDLPAVKWQKPAIVDQIVSGEHPLGKMMLPYSPSDTNDGSGQCRLADLKMLAEMQPGEIHDSHIIELEAYKSIQLYLKGQEEASGMTNARRLSNTLDPIISGITMVWLQYIQGQLKNTGLISTKHLFTPFEDFVKHVIPFVTEVKLRLKNNKNTYFVVVDILEEQSNYNLPRISNTHHQLEVIHENQLLAASDEARYAGSVKNPQRSSNNELLKLAHKNPKELTRLSNKQRMARISDYLLNDARALPSILVAFDFWNLSEELHKNYGDKVNRQELGKISAGLDLMVTSLALLTKLDNLKHSRYSYYANYQSKVIKGFRTRWFGPQAGGISNLSLFGWFAAQVTIATVIWDAVDSIKEGDYDSGYAQIGVASGLFIVSHPNVIARYIVVPAASKVLGISVVASTPLSVGIVVAGLGLAIVSQVIASQTEDDSLTKWLRNGPFGSERNLQDPVLFHEIKAYKSLLESVMPVKILLVKHFFETDVPADILNQIKKLTGKNSPNIILELTTPAFDMAVDKPQFSLDVSEVWTKSSIDYHSNPREVQRATAKPQYLGFAYSQQTLRCYVFYYSPRLGQNGTTKMQQPTISTTSITVEQLALVVHGGELKCNLQVYNRKLKKYEVHSVTLPFDNKQQIVLDYDREVF